MSHNKQLKERQDHDKVNSNEPKEVEDLHQKYPNLASQVVKDAIDAHGPDRKKIETYLNRLGNKK